MPGPAACFTRTASFPLPRASEGTAGGLECPPGIAAGRRRSWIERNLRAGGTALPLPSCFRVFFPAPSSSEHPPSRPPHPSTLGLFSTDFLDPGYKVLSSATLSYFVSVSKGGKQENSLFLLLLFPWKHLPQCQACCRGLFVVAV